MFIIFYHTNLSYFCIYHILSYHILGKKKKTVLSTTSPSHLAEKSKAPQDSVTTNWLPERISSKQFTYKGPLVIRAKQDSTVVIIPNFISNYF